MNTPPSSLADLLADCDANNIRLAANGDKLEIDAPRDALTDDLLARLRAHKAELLAILRPPMLVPEVWRAVLDRLEGLPVGRHGDPLFPPYVMDGLRTAETRWSYEPPTPVVTDDTTAKPTKPVCRCGSITWRDVPIHGGRSTRRDCARCGRFISFPVWYGKTTG